jgi:hypothetical protein
MKTRIWTIVALAALLFSSTLLRAEPAPTALDTNALALIRRVADFYAGLKSMSVDVESSIFIKAEGMRQEFVSRHHVSLERPAKLGVHHTYGVLGSTLIYRETNMVVYVPELKRYFQQQTPGSVDELLNEESLEVPAILDRTVPVLTTLIATNTYDLIMEDTIEAQWLPPESMEGQECRHIRLLENMGSVDIWISTGDQPAIYQVLADISRKMAEEQGMADGEFEFKMITKFSNWSFDQPIPDADFIFTPPPGAISGDMEEEDMGSFFENEIQNP